MRWWRGGLCVVVAVIDITVNDRSECHPRNVKIRASRARDARKGRGAPVLLQVLQVLQVLVMLWLLPHLLFAGLVLRLGQGPVLVLWPRPCTAQEASGSVALSICKQGPLERRERSWRGRAPPCCFHPALGLRLRAADQPKDRAAAQHSRCHRCCCSRWHDGLHGALACCMCCRDCARANSANRADVHGGRRRAAPKALRWTNCMPKQCGSMLFAVLLATESVPAPPWCAAAALPRAQGCRCAARTPCRRRRHRGLMRAFRSCLPA
jgi:hypothetical protein